MIVKAQLSLATNGPQRSVLVYNEDRTIFETFWESQVRAVAKVLDGKPLKKAYFKAHLDGGQLLLDEEVEEQSW